MHRICYGNGVDNRRAREIFLVLSLDQKQSARACGRCRPGCCRTEEAASIHSRRQGELCSKFAFLEMRATRNSCIEDDFLEKKYSRDVASLAKGGGERERDGRKGYP